MTCSIFFGWNFKKNIFAKFQSSGAFFTLGSGIRCLFFTPGFGSEMGKKFRIRIRDKQPGSYFRELIKQFYGQTYLNFLIRIRDPGWKKFESGMKKIRSGIRYKHPGSVTLQSLEFGLFEVYVLMGSPSIPGAR